MLSGRSDAVGRLMPRRRKPPSQTWRAFLDNHVKELVTIDFFAVPTATFRVLFVLLVLAHDRRRVVHFNVSEHPYAEWTALQIVQAFPLDTAPRYMLRDRDGVCPLALSHVASHCPSRQIARVGPSGHPSAPQFVGSCAAQYRCSAARQRRVPGVVAQERQHVWSPDTATLATAHSSSRAQARSTAGGPASATAAASREALSGSICGSFGAVRLVVEARAASAGVGLLPPGDRQETISARPRSIARRAALMSSTPSDRLERRTRVRR